MAQTYCDAAPGHEWHGPYHEREYGFPLENDAELFERLVLEINQAGLSWLTILKKREAGLLSSRISAEIAGRLRSTSAGTVDRSRRRTATTRSQLWPETLPR